MHQFLQVVAVCTPLSPWPCMGLSGLEQVGVRLWSTEGHVQYLTQFNSLPVGRQLITKSLHTHANASIRTHTQNTNTHTHAHTHTGARVHTHTCTCTHIHTTHTRTRTCTHTHTRTNTYTRIHIHKCAQTHIRTRAQTHIHTLAHTHTHSPASHSVGHLLPWQLQARQTSPRTLLYTRESARVRASKRVNNALRCRRLGYKVRA